MGLFKKRKKQDEGNTQERMTVGQALRKERFKQGNPSFEDVTEQMKEFCTQYENALDSKLEAEQEYEGSGKRVYVLANMGLYESSQLENLFSAIRQWCSRMGFDYCGGLGVSAGELIGGAMELAPFGIGPSKCAAEGIEVLRQAIEAGQPAEEILAEPWKFPRALYLYIANTSWNSAARKNGMKPKDLYRKL